MIVADRIHKKFDDGFVAVKEATFTVRPREIFGLLGGNGAGKTTTVNIILGFLPPTSGRALINGVDVQENPLEAKKHVGYVSENVLLYGTLTAEQNLGFFADLAGVPVPRTRLEDLLDRVGLKHAAKRRVETFSKGMRQRLGIAIALAKDPPAIILDEPTTGLDPQGAEDLISILASLRDGGKALLLVTHDLYRLPEFADTVAVMRSGEVALQVPAASIRDPGAFYRETTGVQRVAA